MADTQKLHSRCDFLMIIAIRTFGFPGILAAVPKGCQASAISAHGLGCHETQIRCCAELCSPPLIERKSFLIHPIVVHYQTPDCHPQGGTTCNPQRVNQAIISWRRTHTHTHTDTHGSKYMLRSISIAVASSSVSGWISISPKVKVLRTIITMF